MNETSVSLAWRFGGTLTSEMVSKTIMKRIVIWLGTAVLTFTIGVAASMFWLKTHRVAVKQEPSVASAEPYKADSNGALPILAYCELATNPEKYNGQTVRVSARLSGFIHGILFYNPNCPGVDTRAAVSYNPDHSAEIELVLTQARGSDNWFEPVDIIATGKFKKVTPTNESDTIYDTASLQFEIILIEKASKAR